VRAEVRPPHSKCAICGPLAKTPSEGNLPYIGVLSFLLATTAALRLVWISVVTLWAFLEEFAADTVSRRSGVIAIFTAIEIAATALVTHRLLVATIVAPPMSIVL
jgi:hypothetical protein